LAQNIKISTGNYKGLTLRKIISKEEILSRIEIIASDISNLYKNKNPLIVGVLNGSFIFMSDLIRLIKINYEIDFIKISSYGNNIKSTGNIILNKEFSFDIKNRHVIIIEDIIDSGRSLVFLKKYISDFKPRSLRFASLLYKKNIPILDFEIDWIGFNIDDNFVVGYGLDLEQQFRGLNNIYRLIKE